tara:strand:+ start:160 stop:990 length:831 start_codon:yes stop_codon:yes gene_type:complete
MNKIIAFMNKSYFIIICLILSVLFFCSLLYFANKNLDIVKSKASFFLTEIHTMENGQKISQKKRFLSFISEDFKKKILKKVKFSNLQRSEYCQNVSIQVADNRMGVIVIQVKAYKRKNNLNKVAYDSQKYCLNEYGKELTKQKKKFFKNEVVYMNNLMDVIDGFNNDNEKLSELLKLGNLNFEGKYNEPLQSRIIQELSLKFLFGQKDDLMNRVSTSLAMEAYKNAVSSMESGIYNVIYSDNSDDNINLIRTYLFIILLHLILGILLFYLKSYKPS